MDKSDKCRLCYTDPDPDMCQHIFNTKSQPPIWKIIKHLTNLKIKKNDPYTKNICGPCFLDLVKYSAFRRMILDTDYQIQHEKEQLSGKTCNDCDYFDVHCTPTSSDNDDSIVKEEQIEIEEHLLEIEAESNEEFNNSIAVTENHDSKELVIVDRINNNDKITACYTSPSDKSNETNESQSIKCSTDHKIDFNKDSNKTDGSNIISTNNNDLRLTDNNDKIISDENERSIAKNVGSSKNFDDNSSCINSNNDNNVKKEESDMEMSNKNRKKHNSRNSQRLNVDNLIATKDETTIKNNENTKRHKNARNDLNMSLKVQNSEKRCTLHNYAITKPDERPLKCNICNEQSSDKTNLCRHKQEHTDEKPYRCNICDKTFLRKFILLCHLRCHTGEKPFKCTICNMQFSQKAHLWSHKRVHTGEKPFKCNICNKQFSLKTNFLNHERVHTGEKPFKCDICCKAFKHSGNLSKHCKRLHLAKKS